MHPQGDTSYLISVPLHVKGKALQPFITILQYLFCSCMCYGFSGGSDGRVCLARKRPGFDPWVGEIPWRRE